MKKLSDIELQFTKIEIKDVDGSYYSLKSKSDGRNGVLTIVHYLFYNIHVVLKLGLTETNMTGGKIIKIRVITNDGEMYEYNTFEEFVINIQLLNVVESINNRN